MNLLDVAARLAAEAPRPLEHSEVTMERGARRTRAVVSYDLPANRLLEGHTGFAEVVAGSKDTVVVASPRAATGLRIFRDAGGVFKQEASFQPFGAVVLLHTSLAASDDDVAVGMPRPVHEDDTTASESPDTSIVHMYRRTTAGWIDGSVVTPPASAASGHFGHSVATDGRTLAVGAPNANGGAVYVYAFDAKGWRLDAELLGTSPGDRFGTSVAIAGDVLVVGAPGDDRSPNGSDARGGWGTGAAYVFSREGAGKWVQSSLLKASDAPERSAPACHGMGCLSLPGAVEEFGSAVAMSGHRIVIGAPGGGEPRIPEGSPYATGPGKAYVFSLVPNSAPPTWREEARLLAKEGALRFGGGVAISGESIAIGAPDERPEPGAMPRQVGVGTVTLFARGAVQDWNRDVSIKVPTEPGISSSRLALFGNRLALTGFRRSTVGGFAQVFDVTRAP